jgi:hypothetical protein
MNTKFAGMIAGLSMAVMMVSTGGAAAYFDPGKVSTPDLVTHTAGITVLSTQLFCAKNRGECADGDRGQVTMAPNLLAMLSQSDVQMNRVIRLSTEVAGMWEWNPTIGDSAKRSA